MPSPHGSFIWYELMTSDIDAASAFYGRVIGWTAADVSAEPMRYRVLSAGEAGIAGVMAIPAPAAAAGKPPGWHGYIAVDDVDAAVSAITAAGGTVYMPAMDLPNVGRLALVADPQGVPFYVMRGTGERPSTAFSPEEAGHCAWNELGARSLPDALAFYTAQFGWTQGDSMDMGPMGPYVFVNHNGEMLGAMMGAPQPGPPPHWRFYFRVDGIDAAAARVTEGGGTIHHGPTEVPGGQHIIIASDPQGAMFGLVGPRR